MLNANHEIDLKTTLTTVALCIVVATIAQAQNLEAVLNSMDQAAANFHTAQCDFVWDQYQKVVDDHDYQKGTMYFRRQGNDVQMAADITSPDKKYVLFTGSLVSVLSALDRSGHASTTRARTRLISKAFWCWASAAADTIWRNRST